MKRYLIYYFTIICLCGGCTLEDYCGDEKYAPNGECIDIPTEKENCSSKGFNCMQTGVDDAICEKEKNNETNKITYFCTIKGCKEGYHKNKNPDQNDFMKELCVQDTVEECGESKEDCSKSAGALSSRCNDGKCEDITCHEQYLMDDKNQLCIRREAYSCGTKKKDCLNEWLKEVYNDEELESGTIPVCDKDQDKCILSYCTSNYLKVTCEEFNKHYSKSYGDDYHIPGCMGDDPLTNSICIPDPCPDIINKTGDDDHDGVINCFDPCPNNFTKYDSSKWKKNSEGIRCDIKDTDRDGVDDSEDPCPTREKIRNIDDLKFEKLCDETNENKCPDLETIIKMQAEEKAKLCGIITGKSNNEFHIYNAKDLEILGEKLISINARRVCSGNSDECTKTNILAKTDNQRTRCIEDVIYRYTCKGGCSYDENKRIMCKDEKNEEVLEPTPIGTLLTIYLENDINLDDLIEPMYSESNTDKFECYGMFGSVNVMIGVEFNGKNNTIRYNHRNATSDENRCSLMKSLFNEIKISNIHHLKLDYDVKGFGHGILADRILSSTVSDIEIINGKLNSYVTDAIGVGGLAGSLGEILSKPMILKNIKVTMTEINAPNAFMVGGIIGNVSQSSLLSGNISMKADSVIGYENVGGIFGKASLISDESGAMIRNQVMNVKGVNKVGGAFGTIDRIGENKVDVKNEVNNVTSETSTGGFAGYIRENLFNEGDGKKFLVKNYVKNLSGKGNIGGFAGENYSSLCPDNENNNYWLYNHIENIEPMGEKSNIGGIAGTYCLGYQNMSICKIYNNIDQITGYIHSERGIGGMIGYTVLGAINGENIGFSKIYNQIGSINAKSDSERDESYSDSEHQNNENTALGGVIGLGYYNSQKMNLTFEDIYNQINQINSDYILNVGGFIGAVVSTSFTIRDVYNYVNNIIIDHGQSNGGFIGYMYNSEIKEPSKPIISEVHSEVVEMDVKNSSMTGGFFCEPEFESNALITDISAYMNLTTDAIDDQHKVGGIISTNETVSARSLFTGNSIKLDKINYCKGLFSDTCLKYSVDNVNIYSPCSSPELYNDNACEIEGEIKTIQNDASSATFISKAKEINPDSTWTIGKTKIGEKVLSLPIAISEETILKILPKPDPEILKEIGVTD